jgi:hypothetical protein
MSLLTLNLEEKLLTQNDKIIAEAEEFVETAKKFLINESEDDNRLLDRIFDNKPTKEFDEKNKLIDINNTLREIFGNKLFSIDQIRKTCIKYNLRYLPAKLYRGSRDRELPAKIKEFRNVYTEAYCNHYKFPIFDESNFHIMAPASSFNLKAKPKDPLLFYKVDKTHAILVHKWGNDLNILRRFTALFLQVRYLVIFLLLPAVLFYLSFTVGEPYQINIFLLLPALLIFAFGLCHILFAEDWYQTRWNSEVK